MFLSAGMRIHSIGQDELQLIRSRKWVWTRARFGQGLGQDLVLWIEAGARVKDKFKDGAFQ